MVSVLLILLNQFMHKNQEVSSFVNGRNKINRYEEVPVVDAARLSRRLAIKLLRN